MRLWCYGLSEIASISGIVNYQKCLLFLWHFWPSEVPNNFLLDHQKYLTFLCCPELSGLLSISLWYFGPSEVPSYQKFMSFLWCLWPLEASRFPWWLANGQSEVLGFFLISPRTDWRYIAFSNHQKKPMTFSQMSYEQSLVQKNYSVHTSAFQGGYNYTHPIT